MAEQNRTYLIDRFKDGEIPTGQDFADMIDSSLNLLDDGLTSYKVGDNKRFGIGDTAPAYPLGIAAEVGGDEGVISFASSDGLHKWNINLNPGGASDIPGFSIDDYSSGSISRFFISAVEEEEGRIGIGTVTPKEQVHIAGVADGEILSVQIENMSSGHPGWLLGHIDDNAILERAGAFGIIENFVVDTTSGAKNERMTFLPRLGGPNYYNNVGINEKLPFATLHVSRLDSNRDIRLDETTGIFIVGPIDSEHLVMDTKAIQGRAGEYIGTELSFTVSDLNLQPLGGNIVIHDPATPASMVMITDGGLVGIGRTPVERLDVDGAITFGDTETVSPAQGTVRWHKADPATGEPADLQVFKDTEWTSLTTQIISDGLWTQSSIDGRIYYHPNNASPKVGINTELPEYTLHVVENGLSPANSAAIYIRNEGRSTSENPSIVRSGMEIVTEGLFSALGGALNVGLYVSSVSGQMNTNANIGALINGSVVVGSATGQPVIGANGTNVLAIQNGVAPTTAAGTGLEAGVQIYSTVLTGGHVSTFSIMNGDGTVIQLFQQTALPAENMNDPNSGDINTDLLISNMRDRIDALELRLQALGLIE